jgi:hypothetical protein
MPSRIEDYLRLADESGALEPCLAAGREARLPAGLLLALLSRTGSPPDPEAAARLGAQVMVNATYGRTHGVPDSELLKYAIAATEAGRERALVAYRSGDPDLATETGDLAADVLRRFEAVRRWLAASQPPDLEPVLHVGVSAEPVVELKHLIRDWYIRTGRRPPRRMRGPVYNAAAAAAVREFQRAHGLVEDGVVGPETWGALKRLNNARGAA